MPSLETQLNLIKQLTEQAAESSLSDTPELAEALVAERHQHIIALGSSLDKRLEPEQQQILKLFNWLHVFDQNVLSSIEQQRNQITQQNEQQRMLLRKGQKALKRYSQIIKE